MRNQTKAILSLLLVFMSTLAMACSGPGRVTPISPASPTSTTEKQPSPTSTREIQPSPTSTREIQPVTRKGPESVAEITFERWAQRAGIPYRDVKYGIVNDDGTFATVRITAFLRETAQAGWREYEADLECRNVGGEWQCDSQPYFSLSAAEQARLAAQQSATATAVSQAQAAATATAQAVSATQTAEAIDQKLVELYGHYLAAQEKGDEWLAAFWLAKVNDIKPTYRDAATLLKGLEPSLGHIMYGFDHSLYLMDGLGRNPRELLPDQRCAFPSRDGTRMAYAVDSPEGATLMVGPLEGPFKKILVKAERTSRWLGGENVGSISSPSWSPDDTRIAVIAEDYPGEAIYIVDISSSTATKIFSNDDRHLSPLRQLDWAPHGKQLCYTTQNDLRVINTDGSNDVQLLERSEGINTGVGRCMWAPDGKQIAFDVAMSTYTPYVALINPDGSNYRRVTIGVSPSWSSDGKKILYRYTEEEEKMGLYVMNPDGSDPVPIAQGYYYCALWTR